MDDLATIYQRPVELLQSLIRFDTTNPPGNEAACIEYLQSVLAAADIPSKILARDMKRPNLLARIPGRGDAPPLLLQGHVDVVTTADQDWTHDPFSGVIEDGYVWGRGALDMKGGVAMMVSAIQRAKVEGLDLAGDVILAIVSDEEVDGEYGAKYLVENHPEEFSGVKYAIGEGGGPTVRFGGHKFFTIMVAEKQICSMLVRVQGPAGHGSMPVRGGAMAKLAKVLSILDRKRLPLHVTPVSKTMINTIAKGLPFPQGIIVNQLLNPALSNTILDILGEQGKLLNPLLHNTVSPTIVRGGLKINVIPSEIELELDGRLLPGYSPDDMMRELRDMLGHDVHLEVTRYDPGFDNPDTTLLPLLADIVQTADPQGTPLPILLSGVSDGRYFARLGIQTYGFTPMDISHELINSIHAADERIPTEAVAFGSEVMYNLLSRYGKS